MIIRTHFGRHTRLSILSLAGVLLVLGAGLAWGAVQFNERQLWQTETVRQGWRIDRHIGTPRCRLVDPAGQVKVRRDSDRCLELLWDLPSFGLGEGQDRHLVILLHGLGRSAASFQPMAGALRAEGFEAVAVSYPSMSASIGEHADQIARVIDGAEEVQRVSFVTHSLGGIVIRELLSRDQPWHSKVEVGRVVMLAPPNQGSALARCLSRFQAFRSIAGPSGMELASDQIIRLPAPKAEFGLIIGQASGRHGFNPWLKDNDDGIVRVAETWIVGSHDTYALNAIHSWILRDPEAVAATGRFLKIGRFRPAP